MIILLCGRDQCGLNAHSVDPDSMRIESWSSVDRPLVYMGRNSKTKSGSYCIPNRCVLVCWTHGD